jgi:hypothetical protein
MILLLSTSADQHHRFSVSEDWFFGHAARGLGSRITMCSAIFVETETPSAVLFSSGGARGGFGEMTIFKQRFYRWNFFFVNGMFYNMAYILGSWRLGFWELGAKLFVFQEVYETLLYILAPFVLPISLIVQPAFCGYLLAGTLGLYYLNVMVSTHAPQEWEVLSREDTETITGFQRGTPAAPQRARWIEMRVSLLHALQDPANRHQRPELLLRLVQVRQILRQKVHTAYHAFA